MYIHIYVYIAGEVCIYIYIRMREHTLQYTTMIVITIKDGLHHIEEGLEKVVLLGPEQDVFRNTSAFQVCGRPQSEHQALWKQVSLG